MSDPFSNQAAAVTDPARSAAAVTPSNSSDLPTVSRALYVGQGGDLRVTMADGAKVTFPALPGGAIYPLRVARVHASGTSASGIVALG